jgi:serine/threonine protein kinase
MLGEKDEDTHEDFELPFFDRATILKATKNFSLDNKLGEGGFGSVYKVNLQISRYIDKIEIMKLIIYQIISTMINIQGTLLNGQEIAVKRLLMSSSQGLKEFKNEVMLCAKLQHRNLVKVVGFCIEGGEKMLIYEYMSNKSLDSFLFGE